MSEFFEPLPFLLCYRIYRAEAYIHLMGRLVLSRGFLIKASRLCGGHSIPFKGYLLALDRGFK